MKKLAMLALSFATAFAGVPAWAGPISAPAPIQTLAPSGDTASDGLVTTVGCNNRMNCPRLNRGWSNNRFHGDRGWRRNDDRWNRSDRWDRRDRYDRRDRWHRRDRNGAIIGGLAAGALIGGIIASQPRARATGSSHEEYCYSRYRSYRASDNTYQPTNGPRRQCQ